MPNFDDFDDDFDPSEYEDDMGLDDYDEYGNSGSNYDDDDYSYGDDDSEEDFYE